jgi:NADH-quinone oxidoreductase subunit J
MTFEKFIFYSFAAILVFAALRVVTARNPVHSALYLVLCFFTTSALWIMLEAEFLAITLVLVYVGAVMVLFLFVVMMLNLNFDILREGFIRYLPVGAAVAILSVVEMAIVINANFGADKVTAPVRKTAEYGNTEAIGKVLYTDYLLPFEIAAVLLLVAIVAAIALTMRKRKDSKAQDPGKQVQVQKKDRLRVTKMNTKKYEQ